MRVLNFVLSSLLQVVLVIAIVYMYGIAHDIMVYFDPFLIIGT